MQDRFKQKEKQSTDLSLNQKLHFKDFTLKSKEDEIFKRLDRTDFASKAQFKINRKVQFKDVQTAQEIKIKSTSENLKVDFQVVEGTYSGYFFALTDTGNPLVASLETHFYTENPKLTFSGTGSLRTHILRRPDKIGCKGYFKVIDQVTGDEAMAECISYRVAGPASLLGRLLNLFR